jgi:hypothetical protein
MKKSLYPLKTSFNKLRILKYAAFAVAVFFMFSETVYAADVTLQWDADADPNVMGYRVYYDTDSGDPYEGYGATYGSSPIGINPDYDDQNPDPNVVEFTIQGLSDGTYYFVVTAINYGSNPPLESGYSNEVSTVLTTDTADTTPPYTVNYDPAPDATGVSVDTHITLEVRDEGVGVDLSKIFMWVNGSRVDPSISGHSAAYILSYAPTEDFAYEQPISVDVDASDLNGNAMVPDFYTFTTAPESDTASPYTANHDPVPGATGVPVDTLITLEIRDEGLGVDLSTISMWVNGSPVNPTISGDPAAYILSYDPPEDFAYGQSVSVEVDALDLNDNAMMEAERFYTFTTQIAPLSVSSDKSTGSSGGGGGCFISTLGQG